MGSRELHLIGEVTRAALLKHPDMSKLSLARLLKRDNPALFTDAEHARRVIRYHTGAIGQINRDSASRGLGTIARAPYEVPKSDVRSYAPHMLPDEKHRYLILADLHVPYHVPETVKTILAYAKSECDAVILLGDAIDCYQLSDFDRNPKNRKFAGELDVLADMMDAIQAAIKPKVFIWKAGNHELRLERFLFKRARELVEGMTEDFSFQTFMNLSDRKVTWIESNRFIQYHHLSLVHGHEWRGCVTTPVNPARSFVLKARACVIGGHHHRSSDHTDNTIQDTLISGWSVGCACDLHPDYATLNNWNHGFAVLDTRNEWRIENHKVINGRVV